LYPHLIYYAKPVILKIEHQVAWYYNWALDPFYTAKCDFDGMNVTGAEFVPMVFGRNMPAVISSKSRYMLGFNEPNHEVADARCSIARQSNNRHVIDFLLLDSELHVSSEGGAFDEAPSRHGRSSFQKGQSRNKFSQQSTRFECLHT